MDIPKERPQNADETEITAEIAVTASATVLVSISVFLRYLGRWVLKKRVKTDKVRKGSPVYGLDDGEQSYASPLSPSKH